MESARDQIARLRQRIDAEDPHGGAASRERAEACRRLAELLLESDRRAEAAQALQEATDTFTRLPDGDREARECTRMLMAVIRDLWQRPEDRLYLLVARHDREMRRLATQPGTERQRGEIAFKVATILQRRDRFREAADRYQEALALFRAGSGAELDAAACHLRLGGLYHHELERPEPARRHYEEARRLFGLHEPLSEGAQMNRMLCEDLLAGLREHGIP